MRVILAGGPGHTMTYERVQAAMENAYHLMGIDPIFAVCTTATRADHFFGKFCREHGILEELHFTPIHVGQGRKQRNADMVSSAEAAIILHDPATSPDIDDLIEKVKAAGLPLWIG